LVVGIFGGAIPGLAIVEIYSPIVSRFAPWLYPMRNWMRSASHALFGATAAGAPAGLIE
jgi:hypothetical protein